jgi:hypothetical protein
MSLGSTDAGTPGGLGAKRQLDRTLGDDPKARPTMDDWYRCCTAAPFRRRRRAGQAFRCRRPGNRPDRPPRRGLAQAGGLPPRRLGLAVTGSDQRTRGIPAERDGP